MHAGCLSSYHAAAGNVVTLRCLLCYLPHRCKEVSLAFRMLQSAHSMFDLLFERGLLTCRQVLRCEVDACGHVSHSGSCRRIDLICSRKSIITTERALCMRGRVLEGAPLMLLVVARIVGRK